MDIFIGSSTFNTSEIAHPPQIVRVHEDFKPNEANGADYMSYDIALVKIYDSVQLGRIIPLAHRREDEREMVLVCGERRAGAFASQLNAAATKTVTLIVGFGVGSVNQTQIMFRQKMLCSHSTVNGARRPQYGQVGLERAPLLKAAANGQRVKSANFCVILQPKNIRYRWRRSARRHW